MLALKTVLAAGDHIPGGRVRRGRRQHRRRDGACGRDKMRQIGVSRRQCCITHLAPVAAAGEAHLAVAKVVRDGRTLTEIAPWKERSCCSRRTGPHARRRRGGVADPRRGPPRRGSGMTADAFELVPLRGGVLGIRSREYDEICHPGIGSRAEAGRRCTCADSTWCDAWTRRARRAGRSRIWGCRGWGRGGQRVGRPRGGRVRGVRGPGDQLRPAVGPARFRRETRRELGYSGSVASAAERLIGERDLVRAGPGHG